jgi:hypothetical protein
VKERKELEVLWGLPYAELEAYLEPTIAHTLYKEYDNSRIEVRIKNNSIRPSSAVDDEAKSDEVVVGSYSRPSLLRRSLNALRSGEQNTTFYELLQRIIVILERTQEESLLFKSLSDAEKGCRLLVLFQKDLLPGLRGEITEIKSIRGKQASLKHVTIWEKILGFMLIVLLNLGMLFYIFLFALEQSQTIQSAWVQSFLVWFTMELFLVSGFAMVMSEFMVPFLVFTEMKKLKLKMIDAVYAYQSTLLHGSGHLDTSSNPALQSSFNSAPYLFASTRLAEKHPDTLESKIIREFKTDYPFQLRERSRVSLSNRSRLCPFSAMNNCVAVFLNVVGYLLSSPILSLERCFYDIIGYLWIGNFVYWQAVFFKNNALAAIIIYSVLVIVFGVVLFCVLGTSGNSKCKSRSGVIHLRSKKQEAKLTIESNIKDNKALKFARIMTSVQNSPGYRDGLKRNKDIFFPRRLDSNGSSRSLFSSQVDINYKVSSSESENDIDGKTNTSSEGRRSSVLIPAEPSPPDLSKYALMMQGKVPEVARIIRSHRPSLLRIIKRRRDAPGMKEKLKDELGLNIDLGDCSDDSYVDKVVKDGMVVSSDSDLDSLSDSASDIVNVKLNDLDKDVVEGGDGSDVEVKNSRRRSTRARDASKYVKMLGRTPGLAKKIRSHKSGMHRILQRRKVAPGMKDQLKDELGLKVDLGDCSDDSYVDKDVAEDITISSESQGGHSDSDSENGSENADVFNVNEHNIIPIAHIVRHNDLFEGNQLDHSSPWTKQSADDNVDWSLSSDESNNSSDEDILVTTISSPSNRVEMTNRVVSNLFSKPKPPVNLADRIRGKRDVIKTVGLKKQAQSIEDSFVVSTQARRASILAHHARAQSKLQKRIAMRKSRIALQDNTNDLERNGIIGDDHNASNSRGQLQKLSSFEIFTAKKDMMKNFTAHDDLRKHAIEKERLAAKASLQERVRKKKGLAVPP